MTSPPRPTPLPVEVFRALAAGSGGASAARLLRAGQSARRLLLLRGLLDAALADPSSPAAPAARAAWTLLADVQRTAPAVFDRVVQYPSVGPAARRHLRTAATTGSPTPAATLLITLATTTALLTHRPAHFPLPTLPALTLPSLTHLPLTQPHPSPPPRTSGQPGRTGGGEGWGEMEVRVGAGVGEVRAGKVLVGRVLGEVEEGVRRVLVGGEGGVGFWVDEGDPDRMPGADLREGRLSAAEVREWEALLGEAWGILRRRHWTAAEEIRVLLRVVTPLNAPDGRATSGTPRHAPGLIGLSPPADAYALAETLVHEAQHTKLNAILDHLPLTAPDDGTRYQAPWRDDPRPLLALLHGTYAHLAVAGFWRRETGTPHAAEHFARWRTATHASALTLVTSPSLTPHGHTFVTEMTATLTRWLADPLP